MVTTHAQTGAAVAPSTAFEAADFNLYKDGSATQRSSQAGWTITSPFDSIVGLHQLAIDLSENTDAGFYAAGSHYKLVLTPDETVDSLAVVRVVAEFDIGVQPANVTQNAGTAITSAAGVQEVKVASIAANAITATAINADAITAAKLASDVATEISAPVVALLPTALVGGRIDASVGAMGANVITAAATAADFGTEVAAAVWDRLTSALTTVGSIGKLLVDNIDATISSRNATTPPTVGAIADQVWDEAISGHAVSGSTGEFLANAGAAGVPPTAAAIADAVLDEALSGHSTAGTLGKKITDIPTATYTVPTATENADELLKRDWTSVTGEASRSALNALRLLRNKVTRSSSTLSVKEEDDSTEAWAAALTGNASLDPISEVDPS